MHECSCYDDAELKTALHMKSSSLTLVHVSPAANGAAVIVRERHVFVRETDGPDELGSPGAPPVLLLEFDQNWKTENAAF